jgi:glycosyltransferase involved in cell wall biosynthesis
MGYQIARAVSEHVEAVVATQVFYRESIEASGGIGRAEVSYLDLEDEAKAACKAINALRLSAAGGTVVCFPLSIAFERAVWRRFRDELAGGHFDLVHRLTPQSSALPSPLASLSPAPFVLGPINGGLPYPKQFRRELWREREWFRYARGLNRFFPYVKSTYRDSAAILASGQHTVDRLPTRDRTRVFNVMEVGVDTETFRPPAVRPHREQTTFIFVGRLVPFKCARIAIAAFGASPVLRRHRLQIVGDGPERGPLEEQVRALGLESSVEFLGARPNAEIAGLMQEADVFVFPSIRESGGLVVAEAMATGLSCVATDYGGPAGVLTPECGIKVPLGGPDELAAGFRDALERLAEDRGLRDRLGEAAQERVRRHFTWDAKARMIVDVYRWVLGHRAERPGLDPEAGEDGPTP